MKVTNQSVNIYSIQSSNYFLIYDCDNGEINNIISFFHANKSLGPNSIDTHILQLLKEEIIGQLCQIFNISFSTGVHPHLLIA